MIEVRNVYKSFGSHVVLDGISFEISKQETLAIVGPSGVGKSVLLKIIMGIMPPDAGEVIIGSQNITTAGSEAEKNEIRAQLGVLFQSAALIDSLNLYENIAFPLKRRTKLDQYEIHEQVMQMANELSLETLLLKLPQEVSLGVRKRVGMARALIMKPSVFLLDEPNTGLDPIVGQEVYDLIKMCKDHWGFAGIVISHEIPEVFQVAERVIMLLHGEVAADGSPESLLDSLNPGVQQFLEGKTDGPIKIN